MVRLIPRFLILASSRASICSLITILAVRVSHAESPVQVSEAIGSSASSASTLTEPTFLAKEEVFRRIGIFEEAAQLAGSKHASHQTIIKIYRSLGALYLMAGMFPKAEAATIHSIDLMKRGPEDQLAEEFNALSSIHGFMGEFRKAEKDQMRALAIRKKIGDPLGLALTWIDLASLYLEENKNAKALQYASESFEKLQDQIDMQPTDQIAVRQVMAFSLCRTHRCNEGLPIMKRALDEAKNIYGSESLSVAAQGFALGYVYWMNGDISDASDWMPHSLEHMRAKTGADSPLYVASIVLYSQFLRKTHQLEEARRAEAELRRIQSVVDARVLTSRNWGSLPSRTH